MPITVKDYSSNRAGDEVAFLCDDEWRLTEQIKQLEFWLESHADHLSAGEYVVDVGFSPRDGAAGGGTTLKVGSLKLMVAKGMSLELSEYPPFG
jgi:hypothetical protein